MRFYRYNPNAPESFPASYNNSIFIAQRGSWNRARKIGYRVMMLQLGRGSQGVELRPQVYKQFAWGWLQNENKPNDAFWGKSKRLCGQCMHQMVLHSCCLASCRLLVVRANQVAHWQQEDTSSSQLQLRIYISFLFEGYAFSAVHYPAVQLRL
jgi:hypothetical protein